MADKDLKPVQRSVLLVLMAEGRELPNTVLTNQYRLKLEAGQRETLRRRGLISSRTENRRVYLALGDKGWDWCVEQFTAEVPPAAGHGGAAAYALLASILRYTQNNGASLPDFFVRVEPVEPVDDSLSTTTLIDLERQIRKAYGELAAARGEQVRLADLRSLLGGLDRSEVDDALIAMSRQPGVHVYPESRQSLLTEADRRAAIRIGNQPNHLIVID